MARGVKHKNDAHNGQNNGSRKAHSETAKWQRQTFIDKSSQKNTHFWGVVSLDAVAQTAIRTITPPQMAGIRFEARDCSSFGTSSSSLGWFGGYSRLATHVRLQALMGATEVFDTVTSRDC